MEKVISLAFAAFVFAIFGCADPDLDPLQLDKIKKGTLICLRGEAVELLNVPKNSGACDTFSLAKIADETFDIKAAFLAHDLTTLAEVEYFVKNTPDGPRAQVATIDGSEWKKIAEDKYPIASIKIKASDMLKALGNPVLKASSGFDVKYLFIEADLRLTDGSIVKSSSIVNTSLYQTPLFFPAMNLRVKIVD